MSKLSTRRLGKDGPLVSSIGLGCMGMSFLYGEKNDEESLKVLNRAIDLGCTFWDTADVYGSGENEQLLAKVLKERRSEVFLATKFSLKYNPETMSLDIQGDRKYVLEACQASLDRLGVEYIDLYYQHRVDKNTPIEETVSAMAELVKQGKVKYLGLSECSAETLRRAYKVHPIHALQVEYSPWETSIERNGLLEACRELGVSIIAYSPLGRGFLTGKLDLNTIKDTDSRKTWFPRLIGENADHNTKLVHKFEELAEKRGIKASQVCLSWVLAQGDDFIPIPGTKRLKYLEENIASDNYKLSPQQEKEVREIVKEVGVKGDRYFEKNMKNVNV